MKLLHVLALYHSFINGQLRRRNRIISDWSDLHRSNCNSQHNLVHTCRQNTVKLYPHWHWLLMQKIHVRHGTIHTWKKINLNSLTGYRRIIYIHISAVSLLPKLKLKRRCLWRIIVHSFAATIFNSEIMVLTAKNQFF